MSLPAYAMHTWKEEAIDYTLANGKAKRMVRSRWVDDGGTIDIVTERFCYLASYSECMGSNTGHGVTPMGVTTCW